MTKKDKGRFDDLFSTVRHSSEEKTAPKRKSKSTDPNYIRTTVYLPKSLHRLLKATAVNEDLEMSEIVKEALEAWLKSKE